jgi:hypothetical protein
MKKRRGVRDEKLRRLEKEGDMDRVREMKKWDQEREERNGGGSKQGRFYSSPSFLLILLSSNNVCSHAAFNLSWLLPRRGVMY